MQRNVFTTLARLGRLVNAQPLRMKLESLNSRPRQANMMLPFAQPRRAITRSQLRAKIKRLRYLISEASWRVVIPQP